MIHTRLGCSTISFRHLDLDAALATIAELGFAEIDLGALPGVCDHVPYVLDAAAVDAVAATVHASGLRVRSINGDIGDLNAPLDRRSRTARDRHLDMLLALAAAHRVTRPGAALRRPRPHPASTRSTPTSTWSPPSLTLAADTAAATASSCGPSRCTSTGCAGTSNARNNSPTGSAATPGAGGDGLQPHRRLRRRPRASSSTASAGRIAHVHIRDAVPGNINLSVGNGAVDFARGLKALADAGYHGPLRAGARDPRHHRRRTARRRRPSRLI